MMRLLKIRFRITTGILALVLLLVCKASLFSQQYAIRNFSEGLAQPFVYTINQDSRGFLWIGTGEGLTRYNGLDMKVYTTEQSLAHDFTGCSMRIGNDIWFGHQNGKVTRFDGKKFDTIPTVFKSGITDIEKNTDGTVWASSYADGLSRLDGDETGRLYHTADLNITAFKFSGNKELIAGTVSGLFLCNIDSSSYEITITERFEQISAVKIVDIIDDLNGKGLLIATEDDGIYSMISDDGKYHVTVLNVGMDLKGIRDILLDSKKNLWVATFGNGLAKISNVDDGSKYHQIRWFDITSGMPGKNMNTLFEDIEGNIWCGGYGSGLIQLYEKAFTFYTFSPAQYGRTVLSIANLGPHTFIGTEKGLIKTDTGTGGVVQFYSSSQGLPADAVTALYPDSENMLWIGTGSNGVYRLSEKGYIQKINTGKGTLENSITVITGNDDAIWIGTKKGLIEVGRKTGFFIWHTLETSGLPHNYINGIYIDLKGVAWVTTLSNILAFIDNNRTGKIEIISTKGYLILGPVTGDKNSVIWVGSNGGGIFRVDSDSILNITDVDGLFSDYCYSSALDNKGYLWVGHRGGLSKINTDDLSVITYQKYAGIDPGCDLSRNAIVAGTDMMYFGSEKGLFVYSREIDEKISVPPLLSISSIKVDDSEIELNNKIVLPPGNHKIEISFLGVYLRGPEDVIYHYQMTGIDNEPAITKEGKIVYPNLGSGKYTLFLSASTSEGVRTTNPVTIHLFIKTPVWKQWWFYIVVAIFIASLIYVLIKRNNNKLKRDKEILEAKVKDRIAEIAEKNILLTAKRREIAESNLELEHYKKYLEQLIEERTHELIAAKNKAEESEKLKTAFLQNMSHEIRTPMNAILGFLSFLDEPDAETRKSYISIINRSGQRLLNTINDIIEISKIESGEITVNYVETDIEEVMNFHDDAIREEASKKGLTIKLAPKIAGKKALVETDRQILGNILRYLINNALKFTHEGYIEIGNYLKDKTMVFYVKDTGVGIPADRQTAIFDRFVQAELSNTRPHEGSGLGLSIVKEYLSMLNGSIWVVSEENKGSTFFFSLPYLPVNESANPEATTNDIRGYGKSSTILIVEDNDNSYLFFEKLLKGSPYRLVRAINGYDAVSIVKENNDIALILMDIKMPGLNGYDATKQIREFNKTVPIIAQTAYAMMGDKEKALESGCNDYITKPVNPKRIKELIKKYIS